MTRSQHRKWKLKNLKRIKEQCLLPLEKPTWEEEQEELLKNKAST